MHIYIYAYIYICTYIIDMYVHFDKRFFDFIKKVDTSGFLIHDLARSVHTL